MQGLGSGLLPVNGNSPLIPTLFLSLLFLFTSAALFPHVDLLLGWSQQREVPIQPQLEKACMQQ